MASSAPTESPVDAHAGGRVKKRPRLYLRRTCSRRRRTMASLELPQYAGGFVANGVDFLAIPALERDDWVELGVPIGHRARIIKEHKALHPELW